MRGGIPGKYPAFGGLPLNLYDPFKLFGRMTEEEKGLWDELLEDAF